MVYNLKILFKWDDFLGVPSWKQETSKFCFGFENARTMAGCFDPCLWNSHLFNQTGQKWIEMER